MDEEIRMVLIMITFNRLFDKNDSRSILNSYDMNRSFSFKDKWYH